METIGLAVKGGEAVDLASLFRTRYSPATSSKPEFYTCVLCLDESRRYSGPPR